MTCRGVSFNGMHIAISGNGEILTDEIREGGRITRCIVQKHLSDSERLIQVLKTEHSIMLRVIDPVLGAGEILIAETLVTIPVDKAGHWLVLEYSVDDNSFKYDYSPERI